MLLLLLFSEPMNAYYFPPWLEEPDSFASSGRWTFEESVAYQKRQLKYFPMQSFFRFTELKETHSAISAYPPKVVLGKDFSLCLKGFAAESGA